ncbi:MAG: hypothetical protein [Caudoviricetes sp.]|nr:MAG: hypothetical protein [Caudoviricetes sp.]
MNLRGIANNAIQGINPNISVVVRLPNGYTIDPLTRKQVPAYIDTPAKGQLQALDGDDLKQMLGLNIQGTIRAMYLYGSLAGVIRPDGSSQSHVVFTSNEAGVTKSREWGVFKVLESWQTWCKVAIVYQDSAP